MDVKLSPKVLKQLKKCPQHIGIKLQLWANQVRTSGLRHAQTIKGFHDEPLRGSKKGRRSIRLSKQWRAEYIITEEGKIEFILVLEVHPHDY